MKKSIIVALLLTALPFLVLPYGFSPFETPKVFAAEIAILLLFISGIIKQTLAKNWKEIARPARNCLLVLLVLSLLHLILTPNTLLFGGPYRLQGTLLFMLLLLFSVISADIQIAVISSRLWFVTFTGLCATSLFLPFMLNGRIVGTLGEPNALAATMIFLWPIAFYNIPHRFKHYGGITQITMILMTGAILFLSGSRSAVIAISLQSIIFLFNKKLGAGLIVICCLLLLAISFILPFLQQESSVDNRKQIWYIAYQAGLTSPIVGHGFGSVEKSMNTIAQKYPQYYLKDEIIDSSHNILLDWWIQGGILGVGAFITLLGICFVSFIKRSMVVEISLLIGLLTVLSFNPASIVTLIAFWYCVGQGIRSH